MFTYLSVLFIRQGDYWVAQALEHDIAAQGASLQLTQRTFEETLSGQIALDRKFGREPLKHLPPAPREYWDAFEAADKREVAKTPLTIENMPPAYVIQAITEQPLAAYAP